MDGKNNSQNTGVIIAVVVLLIAAVGLVWYFMSEVDTDNGTETEQTEVVEEEVSEPTIAEFVARAEDFSILAQALEAADLVDVLNSDAEYTVFAPTNEAFEALPEGVLDDLLQNPEQLREVLLYHVVEGRIASGDVVELTEFATVQGGTVSVTLDETAGAGVVLNEDVVVTNVDVFASNGVIHVVDSVLLP